ncbi:hypothetical protein [Helicobacter turcicus]|uniref:Uncharacterized protein n=1 Tax=Helicobacter turcicus TaxID=2867412 RepID=A0ABS7JQ47_9HELI|nr:hypothetical protein [Helicobacter turcicus]MBX7491487.1 hypothetical protein [Helicobacter turcicus]MBX7546343.1 hypothetical protein [Helicobacter turcicus]
MRNRFYSKFLGVSPVGGGGGDYPLNRLFKLFFFLFSSYSFSLSALVLV